MRKRELVSKVIHVFPGLRRGGGPYGYAFFLQQALGMVEEANDFIEILVPASTRLNKSGRSKPWWRSLLVRLLAKMPSWLVEVVLGMRQVYFAKNALRRLGFTRDQIGKLRQMKVIIFHDYRLAFSYIRNYGVQPGQAVFLMPHSPTDHSSEIIEDLRGIWGNSTVWESLYRRIVRLEFEVFQNVKGVVAPCSNALESYFAQLMDYRSFLQKMPIYEVKTGVQGLKATESRSKVLEHWGIPPDARIVGYFGRKHPHKGFDLFVRAAELAYEKGWGGVWFVSAGEGFLPSPKHLPNYVDLGYLNAEQLANAVAAVDLVVVPNRVSYFDLLILEAMSVGKVVLTTPVGGNVCFGAPGIIFVERVSAEDVLRGIEKLLSQYDLLESLGRANRTIFEREYNLFAFARRHLILAQTLLDSIAWEKVEGYGDR